MHHLVFAETRPNDDGIKTLQPMLHSPKGLVHDLLPLVLRQLHKPYQYSLLFMLTEQLLLY